MALDPALVSAQYASMVPMVATLGIEFVDLDHQTCTMLLPDRADYHNHVGGMHGGALATTGTQGWSHGGNVYPAVCDWQARW